MFDWDKHKPVSSAEKQSSSLSLAISILTVPTRLDARALCGCYYHRLGRCISINDDLLAAQGVEDFQLMDSSHSIRLPVCFQIYFILQA